MRTIVIVTLLALLAFAYTQTACVAGATPDFQIDNPPPATAQSTTYTINSDTAIVARVEVTATGSNQASNCDAAAPNAPGICISMMQTGNQVTVTNAESCAALLAQFTVTKVAFFYEAATSASPATSAAPSSAAPSTEAPSVAPSSAAPSTAAPSTAAPSTAAPSTAAPSTAAPSTVAPSSAAPSTAAPSTAAPTTAAPSTVAPSSAAPSTAAPTTAAPSTAAPSSAAPSTAAPSTAPTTAAPSTAAPSTAAPSTAPTTSAPESTTFTTAAPESTVQGPNPTSASCANTDISGPNLASPGKRLAFLLQQATVCSGHGKCNGNVCACDAGWSGSECNVATTTQTPGSTAQISGNNNARAASASTAKLGATCVLVGIAAFFILV